MFVSVPVARRVEKEEASDGTVAAAKRSDDLTVQGRTHEFQGAAKARVRRQSVENKVAFFANIHASVVSNLGAHQDIAFDNNITNIGNAYSPRHGVFTAPVHGVYVFHGTISGHTPTVNNHNYVNFDRNGHTVASFRIDKAHQTSQMIVLSLNAGDEVALKNVHVNDAIYGATWSTFSGFLLYENFGDQIVVGK